MSDYPFLYIYPQDIKNNITGAFDNRVCVKSCPKKNENLSCQTGLYNGYCNSHKPDEDTTTLFGRFCMPTATDLVTALFNKYFGFLQAQEYFEAIFEVWWALIVGAILSIVLSMILIMLMKYVATFLIILVCVSVVGGLGFLGYYFYRMSYTMWDNSKKTVDNAAKLQDDSWTWFWVAIGVWIVDALVLMFVLCSCCVIGTAVKVMDLAGEFLTSHCSAVFIPLITCLMFIFWCVFWLLALLFLYSIGDVKISS